MRFVLVCTVLLLMGCAEAPLERNPRRQIQPINISVSEERSIHVLPDGSEELVRIIYYAPDGSVRRIWWKGKDGK